MHLMSKVIKGLKIKTTSPSQSPSFPGLTGESRKALDARSRPAGMTRQKEWNFRVCQFNNEILNKRFTKSSEDVLRVLNKNFRVCR
jgi:hypothetical protein